jgi:hypothetical protein
MGKGWKGHIDEGVTMSKVKAYKFSASASDECPDILHGMTPQEFLKAKYERGCIFGLDYLKQGGSYRFMGWSFDFTPYLKHYVFKQYCHWQDVWAPNKTALKKSTYGRIDKVVEIPE